MKLVSQVVRHLRCQTRSLPGGRELECPVLAHQDHLTTVIILHGDLVGAVAVDVCAHFLPPFADVSLSSLLSLNRVNNMQISPKSSHVSPFSSAPLRLGSGTNLRVAPPPRGQRSASPSRAIPRRRDRAVRSDDALLDQSGPGVY